MRIINNFKYLALSATAAAGLCVAQGQTLPRLRVSDNARFFVQQDGSPFLYLGDTAWGLFHFNREDADLYLKDRAAKKFTVIQAIIAHWGGLDTKNAYGQTVFVNRDPKQPNEEYFRHVDWAVTRAESMGLYVALVPIWSVEYVRQERSVLDKSSAFSYGKFLGNRYRDKPVIWILGGDWLADGLEDVWRAMAAGITEGGGGTHLKTFHPTGVYTSSRWFHNDPWLDFNMLQTGHKILNRSYELVERDYVRSPAKPVVDGESGYEGIVNNLVTYKPGDRVIEAEDVRRMAYCSVFAGAAGVAYGSHGVWNYRSSGRQVSSRWGPDTPFREALQRLGGSQLQYLRALIESRPMLLRLPDQWMLNGDPSSTANRVQATKASDCSYAFVYISTGAPVSVRVKAHIYENVKGKVVKAYWYDPRLGTSTLIGDFQNPATLDFKPPTSGPGNDWVLVLDDASKNYPAPGKKAQ